MGAWNNTLTWIVLGLYLVLGPVSVGLLLDSWFPLVSVIFLILFVISKPTNRDIFQTLSVLDLTLLLFALWNLISLVYTHDSYNGITEITRMLGFLCLYGVLVKQVRSIDSIYVVKGLTELGTIILAGWSLWIYVVLGNFGGARLSGPFGYPNWLGGFMAMGAPLLIVSVLQTKSLIKQFTGMLAAGIVLTCLFFTYSRGAWVAYGAASLFLLGASIKQWKLRGAIKLIAVHLVAALLVLAAFGLQPAFNPSYAGQRAMSIVEKAGSDGRLPIWLDSLKIARDYFPFGAGIGSWQTIHMSYYTGTYARHAHNHYLEVLAEQGVIGLILFLSFLTAVIYLGFSIVVKSLRNHRADPHYGLKIGLFSSALVFILHIGVETSWSFPPLTIFFFVILGLMSALKNRTDGILLIPQGFRRLRPALTVFLLVAAVLSGQQYLGWVFGGQAADVLSQGNLQEAAKIYEKASRFDLLNPRWARDLAVSWERMATQSSDPESEYWKLALHEADRVVSLDPYNGNNYRLRAQFMLNRDDSKAALEDLHRALELHPRDVDSMRLLGDTLWDLERKDEALKAYQLITERNPKKFDAWFSKADAFVRMGDLKEAQAAYEHAVALNARSFPAQFNLGWVYQAEGLYEQALDSYKKSIRIDPLQTAAWNNGTVVLETLGRQEEAEHWRKQIEVIAARNQQNAPAAEDESLVTKQP